MERQDPRFIVSGVFESHRVYHRFDGPVYASYYTKEVMVILIREFATADEEMKKITLKVVKRAFANGRRLHTLNGNPPPAVVSKTFG